jgi:type VI protein secretion system component Hcp
MPNTFVKPWGRNLLITTLIRRQVGIGSRQPNVGWLFCVSKSTVPLLPLLEKNMTAASVFLALALTIPATSAFATYSVYVAIPGVPGDSTSEAYRNTIDATSVSVDIADRVCNGFTVAKSFDSASGPLTAAAANGTVYPSMSVYVVKDGGAPLSFATYSLSNVLVGATSAKTTSTTLVESVTFFPALLTVAYRVQRADGSLGGAVSYSINCGKVK